MQKIYTKTGDEGTTSLRDGMRVSKDDLRIETNGQIDHLNSLLGIVRASLDHEPGLLFDIQRELMAVMSHIATPDGHDNPRPLHCEELTVGMEQAIDRLNQQPTGFVIPGESLPSAFLHTARTQARTVERRLWSLHREHPVHSAILIFFNRLSDYLFALANAKTTQSFCSAMKS